MHAVLQLTLPPSSKLKGLERCHPLLFGTCSEASEVIPEPRFASIYQRVALCLWALSRD